MPAIHDRIKLAMTEAGVKTQELATSLGVSRSAVYQWLNGDVKNLKPENLVGLSKALKVRVEWLAVGELPMRHQHDSAKHEEAVATAMEGGDRRGLMRRETDRYPDGCMEAARLLSVLPDCQRKHLIETIRMVYTAATALKDQKIAAAIVGSGDMERQEFYNRWIEQKQEEWRARDQHDVPHTRN